MVNKTQVQAFLSDLIESYNIKETDANILVPMIESMLQATEEVKVSRDQWKMKYMQVKERVKEALKEPKMKRRGIEV